MKQATSCQSVTLIQAVSLRTTRLKRQCTDYKREADDELSSQYIKLDPSHPNKQSGDNSKETKSKGKDFLSRTSYHNKPNESQHGMEVLDKNFQLVVPSTSEEPEVSLGSDLIVPCFLSPEISALDLEISWSTDTACVCVYKDKQVIEGVLFKDRASLFTHKLREGNVSLRLKNFRPSDIGNYHCQVSGKDRRERITVRVRINPSVQSMSQSPIFPDGNEDKNANQREPNKKLSRCASHHSDSDEKQHGLELQQKRL
ncbi:butyrophilin-like protein 2 [Puntigrus tetrazona]|uniref:butyrophilin-like protein 2 n=1 Tax=Puntigrus tetrazona TaxID=1606681 RepID=UPI001C8AFDF8|nr:butyrophilin-like protein 2 [Puntigrus tetrazona]